MAFKPNYNFERAERERAKERKKQEKARRRAEEGDAPAEAPASTVPQPGEGAADKPDAGAPDGA